MDGSWSRSDPRLAGCVDRTSEPTWMVARNGRGAPLPGQKVSSRTAISERVCLESQVGLSNRLPVKKNRKFSELFPPAATLARGGGGDRRRLRRGMTARWSEIGGHCRRSSHLYRFCPSANSTSLPPPSGGRAATLQPWRVGRLVFVRHARSKLAPLRRTA